VVLGGTAGNYIQPYISIQAGPVGNPTSAAGIFIALAGNNVWGQNYNVNALQFAAGANWAAYMYNGILAFEFPPYWRLQFNYSSRVTTALFSFDAVTWLVFTTATAAQSVFNSTPPTSFQISLDSYLAGSFGLLSIDWYKLTVP
jgi:hypothetical protein